MNPGVYGDFTWIVPDGGLRWIESRTRDSSEEGRWLVPRTPFATRLGRRYSIKEFPALFRNFADTAVTEDGIEGFANQFGELGSFVEVEAPDDWEGRDDVWFRGESLDKWRKHLSAMRQAIEIWDAIQNRDVLALEELLGAPQYGEQASIPDGDPVLRALSFVKNLVDQNLLLSSPRMTLVPDESTLALQVIPTTLAGALWLQLAVSIDERREYRRCQMCQRWFEISPESKQRKSRLYCSNACRVRAYRERQAAEDKAE